MSLLDVAEAVRLETLPLMRHEHGQYFTPAPLAELVVSQVRLPDVGELRVLDLGAGVGALSAALMERVRRESPRVRVRVTAVELDADLLPHLRATLPDADVVHADVLELAALGDLPRDFDVVVLNPPYGKLAANSAGRRAMHHLGVDVPNLYAAFWSVAYLHTRPGGQVAAIIPRSWANGAYFKRFREHLLAHVALDHIHAFASRSSLFADAKVLQENVVVTATRDGEQGAVMLAFDRDPARSVPWGEVVVPGDAESYVRIPNGSERPLPGVPLADLGLKCSTGRVVDFRARDRLTDADAEGAVPLYYAGNVTGGCVVWPRAIGKAQGFAVVDADADVRKYLTAPGWHVLVKRFSAKEERRRVVAGVLHAPGFVAVDNKVNVVSCPSRDVAVGLALWLNSSVVDAHFRAFSGHTQVNATDLRTMPYPSLDALAQLGAGRDVAMPEQADVDALVEVLL